VIAYYGGLVMDTLSQASARMAGWERKSEMVRGHSRESGFKKTKNSTNEASMLLKTLNGCGNEAKKYMETKELYENTRNEAKKLLKTKHITFLSGANDARFAHQLAQI
jgi:hypothetical protein